MEHAIPLRRACLLTGTSTAQPYRRGKVDRDGLLRARLLEVAGPGIGYRMAHAMVQREWRAQGQPLNVKRVHRIWRSLGLSFRRRQTRKLRTGSTVPQTAVRANQVWCLDFCHDRCLNGTRLKILAVKDEFTRECLALEVATSMKGEAICRILSRVVAERGAPEYLRSDNGPEFISRVLALWLKKQGSQSYFIKPGSPWQNGHAESFMSRLRAELLDAQAFCNLADARLRLGIYRRYYNEQRPHSALKYQTPSAFAAQCHLQRTDKIEVTPAGSLSAPPPILAQLPVGLRPPSSCARIGTNCDKTSI